MSKENNNGTKVFAAMSGGVDSSVAAGLLKEAGYEVVGVTMCFSVSYPDKKRPSCCGAEGIADARRAAAILDIPHYVLDFEGDLKTFVIDDFTREYLNGRTPNPCVRCNQHIKFGTLLKKVTALGGDFLATGHYARRVYDRRQHCYQLKKAEDARKDQTYFLYGMTQDVLSRVLFPVGEYTKEEVRKLAVKFRLNTAGKPESQDICFVPETGYQQFIKDRTGPDGFTAGTFKDHTGKTVGRHKGIANYTIGQRDKLGLALGYPTYVYKIDRERNVIHVGPENFLFAKGLLATDYHFLGINRPKDSMDVFARIRYNAPEIKSRLTCLNDRTLRVDFDVPQKAVTPGQSVVFYRNDTVLGGGIIDQAITEEK